ncbi:MAG: UbiA family prenyltransferase [Candidatus Lokiarchaeota archaeon]|nr:UbiA family prenyltransferase [Candidatus Lokiarchaeota archaeon]
MTNKIKNIFTLLRVRQYYKNLLVFVGAFFSVNMLDFSIYPSLLAGLVVLCCVSSINYIINDLKDIEDDKKHPEKVKKKPLASGEISKFLAILILCLLVLIALFLIIFFTLNIGYIITVVLLLLTGQLYNHLLKNYAFVDVLTLSTGYLWRALAGTFLIEVIISPWLFLAIFEIAMFLSLAKRKGDLMILGDKENAIGHKKVYEIYSQKILDQSYIMMASSLFLTYALYLIFHFNLNEMSELYNINEYLVIISIPVFLYIIMKYMYLTSSKPEIARNPEKAFFNKGMLIAMIILGGILTYAYYFDEFLLFISSF